MAAPRRARQPAPADRTADTLRILVHVVPGLEDVAADEIADSVPSAELVGAWRRFDERTSLLEYRCDGDPRSWLRLETVEDVFVLAARAGSLRADSGGLGELAAATLGSRYLEKAMRAFTACRGDAPGTFRIIARKAGDHAYRRVDAQRAVQGAIRTRLPLLRLVADDADAEFWLTIIGQVALLGIRLSSSRMRRGEYEFTSLPASLKPTVARAMVRLSRPEADDVILDPLCGSGTLLLERGLAAASRRLVGGDRDPSAIAVARRNTRAAGLTVELREWDAAALPLPDACIDVVLTNPPFGKRVAIPGDQPAVFYRRLVKEMRRVLRPAGCLVLITSQTSAFLQAAGGGSKPLIVRRRLPVLVRGEPATIFVAEVAGDGSVV